MANPAREVQTQEEIWTQCNAFITSSEGQNVIDDEYNGNIFAQYLNEHHNGVVSLAALREASLAPQVRGRLHLKSRMTDKQASEFVQRKAAEEQAANEAARVSEIAAAWVKNICPLGLLAGTDLYEENSNRIVAHVRKHGGAVSFESFNDAVKALTATNSLVWLSDETELRNQPAPPSRESRLSRKAKIDAGLIQDNSDIRNHTKDSKQLVNPADKLRPLIKKLLGGVDPDQQAAEQIGVQGRNGRPDYSFNAKLKEAFANNPDGSVNWKETRKLRNDLANGYERTKNRSY